MKRSSICTTTTLSTNTKTTNIQTNIKTSLKSDKSLRNKTPKLYNSLKKNSLLNKSSFINFSFNKDYQSNALSSSLENGSEYSLSEDSNSNKKENSININNSSKKEIPIISSINKHKKISNLPYYLKNKENSKLNYINKYIKSKRLPEYSSDFIGMKLKKGINFPNINIYNKKPRKNIVLSAQKKLDRKLFYLNRENKFISFGLYFDRDIIDKNNELNKELIKNDIDMDCDSDDENILWGKNICYDDIKIAISKVEKDINSISYIKKNKNLFFS